MFLDDELLMIGRSSDLSEENIKRCVGKMINVCFANLQSRLGNNKTEQSIIAGFNRVNKTWQMVADKLSEEGKGFIKRNGFQLFVESKQEFKGIFFKKVRK